MKLVASILFTGLLAHAFAQTGQKLDYRFSHLTPADGLAGNHVLFIVQDDAGYIWIYTVYDGLQRYDGIRFQNFGQQFLNPETNTYQISELAFFEGHLYVRTADDIFVYNPLRQKFYPADFHDDSPPVSFSNETGDTWKIGRHSLTVYDKAGKKEYERIFLNKRRGVNAVLLHDSARQQYWFARGAELYLLDEMSGKIINTRNANGHPFLTFLKRRVKTDFSNMIIDADDNFWISTWAGQLFKFDLGTSRVKEYSIARILEKEFLNTGKGPLGINHLFLDNHHQLWVPTYGAGLLKYNKESDAFDYIVADKNNRYGIRYNYEIKGMLQDGQENIWVGTDNGISIFNPYRNAFKTIHHEPGNPNSLSPGEITKVFQTKDHDLWVGTWGGGITVYDSLLNFKKRYRFDFDDGNMVWCFAEDGKGRIWAGCQLGWIHRFVVKQNRFEKPFRIFDQGSTITGMTSDDEGNVYLGYNNGNIAKWDAGKDSFYLFRHGLSDGLRPASIQFMQLDKRRNMWITDGRHLYLFDRRKLCYTDSIPLFTDTVPRNSVIQSSSFRQISDSVFLMASVNGKPGYLNVYNKTFTALKINEEVIRKRIAGIAKEEDGGIWFTAGLDLYQYIPDSQPELVNYNINGSVTSSPFLYHDILPVHGGRRAIWTSTEVVVFEPGDLSRSKEELRSNIISITGFRVFDRYILIDSLLRNNEPVSLKHHENFITIEFSPLFFVPVHQKKYVYKLSGVNPDWIAADDHSNAIYTNLKPGNYIFSIRAEGAVAHEQTVSFTIAIAPPFYQKWWFYMLSAIAAAAFIFFFIKRRIEVIRKKAGLKQKMLETEMAALRAQMNPHFIFNCLTAIDNLIQDNEKEKATGYLARFSKLIRNVLDSSRNEVVPFYKDFETIGIFIELEKMRSNDKFDFELNASRELLEGDYKIPPMLIQPFIENAIHHGLRNKTGVDKYLQVNAYIENDLIVYTITDNGVGRKKAEELKQINRPNHISYGIKISDDRIRIFNGHRENKNPEPANEHLMITDLFEGDRPAGTLVKVKLKINS